MKLLALLIALAFPLQPALAADDKKPEEKKSVREKREEAKEKEKEKKRQEEIKKEQEKRKKEQEEQKKRDAKSGLPAKPGPPAAPPKKQKTDMIDEDVVALLKPYDTNGDFEIDVEEFKTVETEFKKNPKGPLKSFDKANDGKLDAMIDRTGMNVKLGSAAPKTKKAPAPAPVKKPDPPAPEPAKPATPAPAPAPAPAPSANPPDKKP